MKILKKIGVLLFSAGCLFSLSGCNEAEKSYNAGLQAYDEGDFEKAEENYLLAVSQGQKGAVIHADLSLAYQKQGKEAEAEEAVKKALEMSPEDPDVLKKTGLYYYYAEDYKQALSYFQKSLTSDVKAMSDRDLETCAYAADIERYYGSYEEAIRIYNILIEAGYYPAAHELLAGKCYLSMNQVDAACQYFDIVSESEGAIPEYFLTMYKDLNAAGAYTKAEMYLAKGLPFCDKEDTMTRAEYYASAGKYEIASSLFETEESLSGLLSKARTLQESGEYEEAQKIYEQLLSRGDDTAEVYNQLMILKIRTGAYDEALQLLTKLRTYNKRDITRQALWNEVILYELAEDYETAYDKLSDYLKAYPGNAAMKREARFLSRVKK